MPGRKTKPQTDDEALHEFQMHERIERGEKITGEDAEWLDRRGTAANAGQRGDALSRHTKHDRERRRYGIALDIIDGVPRMLLLKT